jgi:hypothetical protein
MPKTYDPKLYSLVIAGIPIPSKGYADGEFISVERASDKFTKHVGTDGSVTRAKQGDDSGTCTFSTMQGADINAVLSTLYNLDANSDNGEGVGPFLLKDRNGLTVYAAKACWIARPPDPKLDKTPTARQWKIDIEALESFEA